MDALLQCRFDKIKHVRDAALISYNALKDMRSDDI
jgi:hypothetical protein